MDMKGLVELANRQVSLENEIADLQEQVKKLQGELRGVAEKELPDAMEELGVEEMRLAGGRVIRLSREYHASISEANMPEAAAWLRANNLDGILKRQVSFNFGKGEDNLADSFLSYVHEKFSDVDYKDKESIHPQTLKAFIRNGMADGLNIPLETFGVFERRFSKVEKVRD